MTYAARTWVLSSALDVSDHSRQVKMTVHFPTLIVRLWLNAVPLKSGKSGFADLPGTAAFVSQPLLSGLDLGSSFELDSKSNPAPCWGEEVRSTQCPSKRSVPGWTSRFPPWSAHLPCWLHVCVHKPPIPSFSLSQIFWQTNSHPMKKNRVKKFITKVVSRKRCIP